MVLQGPDKYKDFGLLFLRIGLGASFMYIHGFGKMFGGPERWQKIGLAMGNIGIDFFPVFWGFMAGFSEFFGGLLLILGLFFRPAAALLAFTMAMAMIQHLVGGDGLGRASHALEAGIVFLSLILIGPGRFSLDAMMSRRRR